MKKFLAAVALLACAGGVAIAGPNAHGTIFVHDANLVYCTDDLTECGLGLPPSICDAADVNLEGSSATNLRAWKVYAAFCEGSAPRLKGIAFGISYDPDIFILGYGNCAGDPNNGALEAPGPGWPATDTGTSIVFQFTQTDLIEEVYWFGGYNYYGTPQMFRTREHPDPVLGGRFADDAVPANEDLIEGFGTMGFDTDGLVDCPTPEECGPVPDTGACCVGEVCTITTEADCPGRWLGPDVPCEPINPCEEPDPEGACCVGEVCTITTLANCPGEWQGEGTTCEPENPCIEPNPVENTSWGQIKANYR